MSENHREELGTKYDGRAANSFRDLLASSSVVELGGARAPA